ncbi:MAG: outer membrane protein assembly factor BamD [Gammaproteobacteria bacterium]|nr:MAG: outer membrane protein assembly factor BamD [Gammaproteobacteria bacterium]
MLLAALLFAGCAGNDAKEEEEANAGEVQMYQQAQRYLRARNYELAIRSLRMLESRYPFGRYAEQAQLELIYAHYSSYEPEEAIETANRFIRLHPQHPNVDYAYYLKGLAAYSRNRDIFARFSKTDLTKRDPSNAREAFAEFNKLLRRFPSSPYAADVRARMIDLRNKLARHEIHVANYYFQRGAYLAAANRGRYVVENFQHSPVVADGLAVMAQGYYLLGMQDLADDAVAVLAKNYPNYPEFDKNGQFKFDYDAKPSWLNRASLGLFDPPRPPYYDTREAYSGS